MAMVDEAFAEQGTFPLDNMSYDLICLIYEKSKGLEALDNYLDDARSNPPLSALFHRIRDQEGQFIQELQRHLVNRVMSVKTENHSGIVTAGKP
jgi:hypothetical protein